MNPLTEAWTAIVLSAPAHHQEPLTALNRAAIDRWFDICEQQLIRFARVSEITPRLP